MNTLPKISILFIIIIIILRDNRKPSLEHQDFYSKQDFPSHNTSEVWIKNGREKAF